ncbi:MAG: flagellar hook-length control protein FliK [Chloroflexi bacterium]|nr:flagellar hook-length control protein FliK [Chloroflexota bacterium]
MQTNLMASPSLETAVTAACIEISPKPEPGLPTGGAGLFAALLESLAREQRLALGDTSPLMALRASGPGDEARADAPPEAEESPLAAEHAVLPAAYALAYTLPPLVFAPQESKPTAVAESPETGAPPSGGPWPTGATAVERETPKSGQPTSRLARSDAQAANQEPAALNPPGEATAMPVSWVETVSAGRQARLPDGQAPSRPQPPSPVQRERETRPAWHGPTADTSAAPASPQEQVQESVRRLETGHPFQDRGASPQEQVQESVRLAAGSLESLLMATPEALPAPEERGIRKLARAAKREHSAPPQLPAPKTRAEVGHLPRGLENPGHEALRDPAAPAWGRQAGPAGAPRPALEREARHPVASHSDHVPRLSAMAPARPMDAALPGVQLAGAETPPPDFGVAEPRSARAAATDGFPPEALVGAYLPHLQEARGRTTGAAVPAEPAQSMPGTGVSTRQLPAAITTLVVSGDREARIRLDPPSLGSVEVTVQHQDGRVSVSLEVGSQEARDALQAALPALRSALERQGFQVEGFSLTHDPSWAMGGFLGGRGQHWSHPSPGVLRQAPYTQTGQARLDDAPVVTPPLAGAHVDYRV